MTLPGLEDPYEVFWAHARDLTAPLTPEESAMAQVTQEKGRNASLLKVSAALAAGFILYRRFCSRKLAEEVAKMAEPSPEMLQVAIGAIYKIFLPTWVKVVAPALISAYRIGEAEARAGQMNPEFMFSQANEYAVKLGDHINDVSADALIKGYRGQVNRKITKKLAAQNASYAFGVPPRAMNSLVVVWSGEENKTLTTAAVPSVKEARSKTMIADALLRRSRQIGETESWTAKEQAKLITWLYAQEHGVLSESATKVWVTKKDERVCPYCGPLHKKETGLGEKFNAVTGEVWSPPLHVNCRCIIVLAKNEVSKAAVGDPYDRDPHGRFAHVEQRAAPESDAWLSNLMERSLREIKADEAKAAPLPSLKQVQLSRLAPLKSPTQFQSLTQKPLQQSQLEMTALGEKPLERPKARPIQLPDDLDLVREAPDSSFDDVPGYRRLDRPIFTIFEPDMNAPTKPGEVFTSINEQWMTNDPIDALYFDGEHRTPVAAELSSYWDRAAEDITESYYRMNPRAYAYYDPEDDSEWYISERDFRAALDYTIAGEDEAGFETVNLTRDLPIGAKQTRSFPLRSVAHYFDLESIVADYKPTIYATTYLSTDGGDIFPGIHSWADNPGDWRVIGDFHDDRHQQLSDYAYKIVYVEPVRPTDAL